LQYGVIGLPGGVFDRGKDIFPLKKRILGENRIKRGISSQQFKGIRDPDAESPKARASTAFALFYGNTLKAFAIHNPAF
jgi:hypothetical protein